MKVYKNPNATEEEIRNCKGDYIGCEICRHVGKCLGFIVERLDEAIRKEEEALPEDIKKEYYASLEEELNK